MVKLSVPRVVVVGEKVGSTDHLALSREQNQVTSILLGKTHSNKDHIDGILSGYLIAMVKDCPLATSDIGDREMTRNGVSGRGEFSGMDKDCEGWPREQLGCSLYFVGACTNYVQPPVGGNSPASGCQNLPYDLP